MHLKTYLKDIKKPCVLLIIALLFALLFILLEYAAHRAGLELRTFMAVIKGIYLWLIAPFLILFSVRSMLSVLIIKKWDSDKPFSRLRSVFVVLVSVVIIVVSFLRGFFYYFSSNWESETLTSDGYIQGSWYATLWETHDNYYIPVAGILKKPFPGWSAEKLTEKVREKYSSDAELVEKQENGHYVFRIQDTLTEDEYIYFHVSNSYTVESNFFLQMFLKDASYFWQDRARIVSLSMSSGNELIISTLEEAIDTGQEMAYITPYLFPYNLYITCDGSDEDIAACAADLTDWLHFAVNADRLPYMTDADIRSLLTNIEIKYGDDRFRFYLISPKDMKGADFWESDYEQIKASLITTYEKYHRKNSGYAGSSPALSAVIYMFTFLAAN